MTRLGHPRPTQNKSEDSRGNRRTPERQKAAGAPLTASRSPHPVSLSNLQRLPISHHTTLLLSLVFQLATPSYLIPTTIPTRNAPTAAPSLLPIRPTKAPAPPRSLSGDPAGTAPTGTDQRLLTIGHFIVFIRHRPRLDSRGVGLEGLSLPSLGQQETPAALHRRGAAYGALVVVFLEQPLRKDLSPCFGWVTPVPHFLTFMGAWGHPGTGGPDFEQACLSIWSCQGCT